MFHLQRLDNSGRKDSLILQSVVFGMITAVADKKIILLTKFNKKYAVTVKRKILVWLYVTDAVNNVKPIEKRQQFMWERNILI